MEIEETEKVLGVAIKDVETDLVISMPKPKRHHHIIHSLVLSGMVESVPGTRFKQGFMTVNGYMSREDTWKMLGKPKVIGSILTSEDMW